MRSRFVLGGPTLVRFVSRTAVRDGSALMVTIRPEDCRVFLDRGYTMFAVVTSSQPKFTIPEEIEDVLRAVRFVRHNAAQYGVRPDRLGVLGASSGGHLTLSIATRGGPGKSDSADPVE